MNAEYQHYLFFIFRYGSQCLWGNHATILRSGFDYLFVLSHWDTNKMVVMLQMTFLNRLSCFFNFCIFIKISLNFVMDGSVGKSALIEVMAWYQTGNKTLLEWGSFVYVPSQWEAMLQCYAVSHWLGTCTKWSMLNNIWPISLPDGTKPLPEPMLTYHEQGPVASIWVQVYKRYLCH